MKQSKNLGQTKSCPNCRKTLLKGINLEGKGKFHFKCPHCKGLMLVEILPKTAVTIIKVGIFLMILGALTFLYTSHPQVAEIQMEE